MTQSSDRLDRIEAILAATAEQQAANAAAISRLEAAQERAQERMAAAEESADREAQYVGGALASLESAVQGVRADIQAVVAVFAANTAAIREESNQRHDEAEARHAESEARHAEQDQRFENLLAEARADRQRIDDHIAANATEHRAFTETIRIMLAELNRIWQRLSA